MRTRKKSFKKHPESVQGHRPVSGRVQVQHLDHPDHDQRSSHETAQRPAASLRIAGRVGERGARRRLCTEDFADWRDIPSEALENSRLRQALKKAVASLSEKYRQVLVLRDVQQLSIAETANVLGVNESIVKTRLLRARLMMRDALAPGFDGAWKKGREYEKVRPW